MTGSWSALVFAADENGSESALGNAAGCGAVGKTSGLCGIHSCTPQHCVPQLVVVFKPLHLVLGSGTNTLMP